MTGKTNRLTLYLIKNEYSDFSEIVKEGTASIEVPAVGVFYFESASPRPPSWLADFFKAKLDSGLAGFRILTASPKGLLLIRQPDGDRIQTFALAFGHGRHFLKDDVVEDRFGLKIVLNSVEKNSLRSIDKVTLGSVIKQSREQMGRESSADYFGIDIDQDLISAMPGRSRIDVFGKTIAGKDAFATSAKVDVDSIHPYLDICLTQFRSIHYKYDFDWIDQIAEVRSAVKKAELNDAVVEKIRAGDLDKLWMAPPEIIDWSDAAGFRYARRRRATLHDDIDVPSLIAETDKPITLDWLKNTSVFLISARTDDVMHSWAAFKCLYAEIEINEHIYVLNNGKWYVIEANFTQQVKDYFLNIPESDVACVEYSHVNEGEYNLALADSLEGSCCLDGNVIPYGGGKSSIEFCDVLTPQKKLIHVKRYSGSAQLSHLFSQGAVSGELFAQDPAFRSQLNEKLQLPHRLENPETRPNTGDYEIVFAIISRSDKALDIPFFSKVTVRNARQRLQGFGYRVTKKKIDLSK